MWACRTWGRRLSLSGRAFVPQVIPRTCYKWSAHLCMRGVMMKSPPTTQHTTITTLHIYRHPNRQIINSKNKIRQYNHLTHDKYIVVWPVDSWQAERSQSLKVGGAETCFAYQATPPCTVATPPTQTLLDASVNAGEGGRLNGINCLFWDDLRHRSKKKERVYYINVYTVLIVHTCWFSSLIKKVTGMPLLLCVQFVNLIP